jgi:hypothetical protein
MTSAKRSTFGEAHVCHAEEGKETGDTGGAFQNMLSVPLVHMLTALTALTLFSRAGDVLAALLLPLPLAILLVPMTSPSRYRKYGHSWRVQQTNIFL